jgi:prevent-host-death family protein
MMAMTQSVNIAEFKDNLSKYLAAAEQGDEIIVCRRNVPVAKFSPVPVRINRMAQRLHPQKGFDSGVKILGDIEGPAIPEEDWNMLRDDFDPLA